MNAIPSQHPKYRTKLCRNYTNGSCRFGQKCSFLHPAPGINPFSFSLAQYLFNWNTLLPQVLALSNQQAAMKKLPQQSPQQPQPQLVDEGPSPTTSLLLSTSDGTSSEQVPQTRRSSRRKKSLCKQFARTGGCSAGAKCRFHHSVVALPSADSRKSHHPPAFDTDVARDAGRTISGGVRVGVRLLSPPNISQEYSEPPQYTEAEPAQQPLQPLYWPGYSWQPFQSYFSTAPPPTAVPVPASMAPSSVMQHGTYHPPSQPPVQNIPPAETRTNLPLGAYEVNGTTYFPTRVPSDPAPAPATCSVPVHPTPYSHAMGPAYPYYAPSPIPSGYFNIPNQPTNISPQTISSDPVLPDDLPVVPLEDYHMLSVQRDDPPHLLASPFVSAGDLETKDASIKKPKDQEFPYRPPKNQQVGHARRISINVKKHARVNSG